MTEPSDLPDAELAKSAAQSNARAFEQLMARHKAWVFRFCRRYTGDTEAALDLTQETFVSAWRAIGRFDEARIFTTWLRSIALNKCRDRSRREHVRRFITGFAQGTNDEALQQTDPSAGPEEGLLDRERLRLLDTAIAALPTHLKEALLLTTLDELSHAEAARLLGVSAKTIETRVYRARRKLAIDLAMSDTEADSASP